MSNPQNDSPLSSSVTKAEPKPLRYASTSLRFFGDLIDKTWQSCATFMVCMVIVTDFILAVVVSSIGIVLFNAFLESSKLQGTFGKKALGMVVTTVNHQRLTFVQALLRQFTKSIIPCFMSIIFFQAMLPVLASTVIGGGRFFQTFLYFLIVDVTYTNMSIFRLAGLILLIVYGMARLNAKRQALHDMIAKTFVYEK